MYYEPQGNSRGPWITLIWSIIPNFWGSICWLCGIFDAILCFQLTITQYTCSIEFQKKFMNWLNIFILTEQYKPLLLMITRTNYYPIKVRVRVMVFSATFNNISVISCRSVLLVEETGGPGKNHQPATSYWHT